MPALLIKILSHALTRQLVLLGLKELARRSDNTVDDQVVTIVEHGLANRVNPVRRATDVAK